jgi:hypothetical protein
MAAIRRSKVVALTLIGLYHLFGYFANAALGAVLPDDPRSQRRWP